MNQTKSAKLEKFEALRDQMAIAAMQALLAKINKFQNEYWRHDLALDAYAMAFAMLDMRAQRWLPERNKK